MSEFHSCANCKPSKLTYQLLLWTVKVSIIHTTDRFSNIRLHTYVVFKTGLVQQSLLFCGSVRSQNSQDNIRIYSSKTLESLKSFSMNPAASRDNTSSWIDRHHSLERTEKSPLIEMSTQSEAVPPTAKISEIDDLDNDREVLNKPRPGVDDGFFDNAPTLPGSHKPPTSEHGESNPSHHPKLPYPDEFDGRYAPRHPHPTAPFPHAPGFGPDAENGFSILDLESIPDVNQYQHKKTLAQGMMDLALFSANANQLRYVLESFDRHPYYYPSVILISLSILLQVAIGLGLILNSRYNVKNDKEICIANRINNYTVIGIFLVTAVNVFVSAFGVANAPGPRFLPQPPPPVGPIIPVQPVLPPT
ncbi:uncharacterized protein NijA [Atheta coriaria]|uniref:uncharacterized protein NijA n=1 Tax=Dalotia coriaria TaxID=877792 RepID=UPI0031F3530B